MQKEASICREWRKGWCQRGQMCSFLHDDQQGGGAKSSSASSKTNYKNDIKNDQLCYQFKLGKCERGELCKFNHINLDDIQLKKEIKEDGRDRFCFPFQKGECRRGDLCKFVHVKGSASNYQGACFAFEKNGTCEKGDGK